MSDDNSDRDESDQRDDDGDEGGVLGGAHYDGTARSRE